MRDGQPFSRSLESISSELPVQHRALGVSKRPTRCRGPIGLALVVAHSDLNAHHQHADDVERGNKRRQASERGDDVARPILRTHDALSLQRTITFKHSYQSRNAHGPRCDRQTAAVLPAFYGRPDCAITTDDTYVPRHGILPSSLVEGALMSDIATVQTAHIQTATEIVAAYVSRNSVPVSELPALIQSVFVALTDLDEPAQQEVVVEALKPAVSIKKSITDEYLISLEDGRKFKSMKRYLAGLGMTPADYRAKWGLPSDYPMVAPAYGARRSELAKTIGLGRKPAEVAPEPAPVLQPEPEAAVAAPKRGRKKAA